MSKSTRKWNLFDNKILRGSIKHKLRSWQSYRLLILLNSSLLVFNVAINSNAKTVTQEEISSNQDLIYTYVKLDEQELFPGAAMAETNSNNTDSSLLPMNIRVKGYEQQLQEIISQGFNSQTLALTVSNLDGQNAIIPSDKQQLPQRQIGNVTELDAQIHGLSISSLVEQWSRIINSVFIQAQQERQPAYVRHQLLLTGSILLGIMLLCILCFIWQKSLKMQWEELKLQESTSVFSQGENLDLSQINARSPEKLILVPEEKAMWERQSNLNVLKRRFPQVGHAIVWLVGLTYIFYFWTVS